MFGTESQWELNIIKKISTKIEFKDFLPFTLGVYRGQG